MLPITELKGGEEIRSNLENISFQINEIKTSQNEGLLTKDIVIQKICTICDNKIANYTCPKCHIDYCSLQCYKSQRHQNCSEQFYQSEVLESLKGLNVKDEQDKFKLFKILKKDQQLREETFNLEFERQSLIEEEDDSEISTEDNGSIDLEQELDQLSIEELLSKLPKEEREKFHQLTEELNKNHPLAKAKLNNLIPLRQLWFQISEDGHYQVQPPSQHLIPTVALPSKLHVSTGIALINAIYAFTVTATLLDLHHEQEATMMLLELAPSLLPHDHPRFKNFSTIAEMHLFILHTPKVCETLQIQTSEFFKARWIDVLKLFEHDLESIEKWRPVIELGDEDKAGFEPHSTDIRWLNIALGEIYSVFEKQKRDRLTKYVLKRLEFLAALVEALFKIDALNIEIPLLNNFKKLKEDLKEVAKLIY